METWGSGSAACNLATELNREVGFMPLLLYPWETVLNIHCVKVVGLERGPLSLVSTTEELLDRKVAAPV
jgi:hypothetical protein